MIRTPTMETKSTHPYLGLLRIPILLVAVLVIYAQTASHEFFFYDDSGYITENVRVSTGLSVENALWAFTSITMDLWSPVTLIGHQALCSLPWDPAASHHVASMLLHGICGVLLLFILGRLRVDPWVALTLSLVFVAHPARIASVAWASELKDMLSSAFALGSFLLFLRARENHRTVPLLASIALFLLCCLSKPSWVGLPLIFAVLEFEDLPRRANSVKRRFLPFWGLFLFFVIALATALIAWRIGSYRAILPDFQPPIGIDALGLSLATMCGYFRRLVLPIGPTFVDMPIVAPHLMMWLGAFILALWAVVGGIFSKRSKLPIFGLFTFLVLSLPSSGLVPFSRLFLSDHYTYLAHLGILIALAPLVDWALRHRWIRFGLVPVIIVGLVTASAVQVRAWKNTQTWAESQLKVDPKNQLGLFGLAYSLQADGDMDGAKPYFEALAKASPRDYVMNSAIGDYLQEAGDSDTALLYFRRAATYPVQPDGRAHRALARQALQEDRPEDALRWASESTSQNHDEERLLDSFLLTEIYSALGLKKHALEAQMTALQITPEDPFLIEEAFYSLIELDEVDRARNLVTSAIQRDPDNEDLVFLLDDLPESSEETTAPEPTANWKFSQLVPMKATTTH